MTARGRVGPNLALAALLVALGPLGLAATRATVDPLAFVYVTAFAALVVGALACVARLNEAELRVLALTDPLTALPNRRLLVDELETEVERVRRYGRPLSLLLIDVDGLKRINDVHGHAAGDRALALVASALKRSVRSTDTAARIGGDEFAVLLPETTAGVAVALAERIRVAVAELSAGSGQPFSVSVGAAEGIDAVSIFAAADRALYAAKAAVGRERKAVREVRDGQVVTV